jgi:hypothetical protein
VLLKSPQIGFQQPKHSLCIPGVNARHPYKPLMPLLQASRFGDVFLNTAEVIFETHMD